MVIVSSVKELFVIFYLATDNLGKTHIVGTQAEARVINTDFQQIDIPTDKAGLMAWVQQMLDETVNAADLQSAEEAQPLKPAPEVIKETLMELICLGGGDGDTLGEYASRIHSFYANDREMQQPVPAPMDPPPSKLLSSEYIQDWLINDANQRDIEKIYVAIGCRVGEILRGARS